MKIVQLTAENIKKISVVQIKPDGNVVQITGKNGQGKTSVLDSIWWALAGTDGIQAQPIRKGQEQARIELSLGNGKIVELLVERKFTETGSTLKVAAPDGKRFNGPQKLLDDLLGSLTFDPLGFMRDDAKTQFSILTQLVKLSIDLDALKVEDKADYDARTDLNRQVKALRAQAAAIAVPENVPDQPVDESKLIDAMEYAAGENQKLEQRKAMRAKVVADIAARAKEVEGLRARVDEIGAQINDLMLKNDTDKKRLDNAPPLPDPTDIAELRADLDRAKQTNALIEVAKKRQTVEAEAAEQQKKADELTSLMEQRAKLRTEALEAAQMPVPGLAFGDGVVLYKDLPLDQASDAEQLMVSTAIAAALNPKLRVIRIRDGSLLDSDAMRWLAGFAEKQDFQIWIERVDGSGTVGIVMEDGHVRGKTRQ